MQLSCVERSDWSPVRIGDDRRTLVREGPRQGKHAQGCSKIGKPPRTPLDVAETKEEQQMEVGKARVWERQKIMQSNEK